MARDAYNEYCAQNKKWYHPVQGAVWFGIRKGWRDWIPDEVEMRVEEQTDQSPNGIPGSASHFHKCEFCEPEHDWIHQDELCTLGPKVACPVIRGKYRTAGK